MMDTPLALKFDSGVFFANRTGDSVGDDREMIEPFFDQQTYDAIGVEDEVCSVGVLVADHANLGREG